MQKGTTYPSVKKWKQVCHSIPCCSCSNSQGEGPLLSRGPAAKNAEKRGKEYPEKAIKYPAKALLV